MRKKSFAFSIVDIILILIIAVLTLICLAPFLYIISMSLSDELAIVSHKVTLYPIGLNLEAYKAVLSDLSILHSFVFSVFLTIMATIISMFLTVCIAYPLTKTRLKGRHAIFFLVLITMYFSGGIIPDFILVKSLNLLDTVWALLLPSAISTFNVIILKTFLQIPFPSRWKMLRQLMAAMTLLFYCGLCCLFPNRFWPVSVCFMQWDGGMDFRMRYFI